MKKETLSWFNLFVGAAAWLLTVLPGGAQRLGDPGWEFDTSKFDTRIPSMREWAKAGVRGGIPYRSQGRVRQTLQPSGNNQDRGGDIQGAIDRAASAGGGVVLLKNGQYYLRRAINFKNNVILRGESRAGVQIFSEHRYQGPREAVKTTTFNFNKTRKAGMEDLRVRYRVYSKNGEAFPLDHDWKFDTFFEYSLRSQNYQNERVYYDRKGFKFEVQRNLDVNFALMDGAEDCWIDNCEFRNSASNGIRVNGGQHNTIRRTTVIGAFQKGSNGHGYGINCAGRYVLMTGCRVERVRHWAIQLGSKYCVMVDNFTGTDVNFHNRDDGDNLVERNEIKLPRFHLWKVFQGGANFHGDPGKNNMFYRNDAQRGNNAPEFTDRNKIYTFVGKDVQELPSRISPRHGVLYAVRRKSGGGSTPPPSTGGSGPLKVGQTVALQGPQSFYVSSENGGKPMTCDRTMDGRWERFVVVNAGGGKIALRGSNNRYVTARGNDTPMICNAGSIGAAQSFTQQAVAGGKVVLKANNGRYVSSESGRRPMTTNRTAARGWEQFRVFVK